MRVIGAALIAALVAGLPLAGAHDPAHGQSAPKKSATAPKSDPLPVLRAIYAVLDKPREQEPFSKRLMALYDAASKRSKELNEPVPGIDFDYAIDGQDYEPGLQKTLRYQVLRQDITKASVKVTFRNATLRELRYEMVFEGGRWVIDDVRSVRGDHPWVYSALLREGANAK